MKRFPPLNVTALVLVNDGNGQFHWDGRTRNAHGDLLMVTQMDSPEMALGVLLANEIDSNPGLLYGSSSPGKLRG
jgi:hypothetical protein